MYTCTKWWLLLFIIIYYSNENRQVKSDIKNVIYIRKKNIKSTDFHWSLAKHGSKLYKYLYVTFSIHTWKASFHPSPSDWAINTSCKKNLPINILSKINVGSRSYTVWSWEIWVRYQANGEAILFQSQMTVNLKLNLILSTDTMVMELIKGKWGFLTNSEMLLPEDNIFFVCYSRSDEAVLAKKWCCWWLECRNLLPNFYFFSNFFYHHGNHVHLLICRLEVQVASRTLRGKWKELKFAHKFYKDESS